MRTISTRTFVASVAAAAVVGGGGALLATASTSSAASSAAPAARQVGPPAGPMRGGPIGGHIQAAATYLGLTVDALRAQLQGGKSLADVAKAQGKSVDGLEQAIVAAAKKNLDAAVASGRLSADQAKQRLEQLQANVDDIVDHTCTPGEGPRPGTGNGPGFRGGNGPGRNG